MNINGLKELLKGEIIKVLNNKGAIQIDFEYNKFLALIYNGKDLQGYDDYFPLDIHETIEEALQQIQEY